LGTAIQTSFDDLSTPLFDVTFAVLDFETTGLSPTEDRITEVGVVKARRGEILGEFATLVRPDRSIPAAVSAITGITDAMVAGHPPIDAVLPALVEFLRGTVLVAHNAGFDTRFLQAALQRHTYPPLTLPVVDTAAVARRVLRDEVRDFRLANLARHVRATTAPEHRALPDARATLDVLHHLIARVGSLGATTLEDLQAYARSTSDRAFRKIDLVRHAPSQPGVYRFLGPDGEVLYVGKAGDLRTRLRRYFGQDRRRRVDDLVRETARVDWTVAPTELEAAVAELRAIREHRPRYNRRSKFPERQVHVKLTAEAFPRLSIVPGTRSDGATYVGPVGTRRTAERFVDAVHEVSLLRRCTQRLRRAQDHAACVLKDLGRCGAPCDGSEDHAGYAAVAGTVRSWLADDPGPLLDALRERMLRLAAERRFEDAAVARGRIHLTARVLARSRQLQALGGVAEVTAVRAHADGLEAAHIVHGQLVATAVVPGDTPDDDIMALLRRTPTLAHPTGPPSEGEVEEVELVAAWLDRPRTRLLVVTGAWCEPVAGGRALAQALSESRRVSRLVRADRQLLAGAKVARRDLTPGRTTPSGRPAAGSTTLPAARAS
jgi:DNA polymerase III subunit epsilon